MDGSRSSEPFSLRRGLFWSHLSNDDTARNPEGSLHLTGPLIVATLLIVLICYFRSARLLRRQLDLGREGNEPPVPRHFNEQNNTTRETMVSNLLEKLKLVEKATDFKSSSVSEDDNCSLTADARVEMTSQEISPIRRVISGDDSEQQADKKESRCSTTAINPLVISQRNRSCVICLVDYKNGDTICKSGNPECRHMFHKDCIVRWLVNHDECPMCRQPFVSESIRLQECLTFSETPLDLDEDDHSTISGLRYGIAGIVYFSGTTNSSRRRTSAPRRQLLSREEQAI